MTSGCITVLNAGSSSIKFGLYEEGTGGNLLFRGQIERIGSAAHLKATNAEGRSVAERSWPKGELDHHGATLEIVRLARELLAGRPVLAVGHRVVHGGTEFSSPVRVNSDVLAKLAKLVPLAPLHQPHNLAPIEAIAKAAPQIPQVACFDTAFHRTQPATSPGICVAARPDGSRRQTIRLSRPVVRLCHHAIAGDSATRWHGRA